ncbi:2-succinyl-6-hydroxy-2,4-cyclohexadiene-1-carboxylate synthase [Lyngbya aestuarii BL J]|uniref:Putative 2-succinyl-6-hydroxy-2,4-cyclohexadiene-1-carboxylate synthase n=2 Tax=Lyngbya aestuarii TaxID=118322 RepID=U7QQ55_9CYAN|nr:2-succinyl-6-hydroxy-2,4-cyclohexadiene-1-carboxylate synthase [Lyngbya aestuarii BL J]
MGNGKDFNAVISLLSEKFNCLAVDLPGHGNTQVNGTDEFYSLENTANGLICWLEELNIKRCFLVGYSMGGRLALYLALNYSQYFQKVILESASPGLKTEKERTERYLSDLQLAEELEELNLEEFLTCWYDKPLFKTFKTHPNFNTILARRLQNNSTELAKSLRWMGTGNQPPLWDKLSTSEIPLLLLAGELDEKFIKINREMANICSTATLEIVPGCGHNIHVENPQRWVEVVQGFLLS